MLKISCDAIMNIKLHFKCLFLPDLFYFLFDNFNTELTIQTELNCSMSFISVTLYSNQS